MANSHTQAYPSLAERLAYFVAEGVEEITENNPDGLDEFRDMLWRLLNRTHNTAVLSCYAATTTTFNVVEGNYLWEGTEKTYVAGVNVNPTDNDTTYVWMNDDNTIDSVIDGTGWPAANHLKLAEVVVDVGGDITNIIDRRMGVFYSSDFTHVVCNVDGVIVHDGEIVTN